MQLILLQNVTNLGKLGDKVNVKPGYGRNFLVPQGKAVPATATNLAEFEAKRAEYEAKAKALLEGAEGRKAALEGATVSITANASTEGKLYGSIGPRDIADALTKIGHKVEKSEVVMGEGPLRRTGEFDVLVHLHADVETTVKVIVVGEAA
jgi:large subunit ribosomal protein L9